MIEEILTKLWRKYGPFCQLRLLVDGSGSIIQLDAGDPVSIFEFDDFNDLLAHLEMHQRINPIQHDRRN